jgi:hypothetical protein
MDKDGSWRVGIHAIQVIDHLAQTIEGAEIASELQTQLLQLDDMFGYA